MIACVYKKKKLEIRSSEEVFDYFYSIIFVTFYCKFVRHSYISFWV